MDIVFECRCDANFCGGDCSYICGSAFHGGEGSEGEGHHQPVSEEEEENNNDENTQRLSVGVVAIISACAILAVVTVVASAIYVWRRKHLRRRRHYRRQIESFHDIQASTGNQGGGEVVAGEPLETLQGFPIEEMELQPAKVQHARAVVRAEALK